jgi:hypothetical protein
MRIIKLHNNCEEKIKNPPQQGLRREVITLQLLRMDEDDEEEESPNGKNDFWREKNLFWVLLMEKMVQ